MNKLLLIENFEENSFNNLNDIKKNFGGFSSFIIANSSPNHLEIKENKSDLILLKYCLCMEAVSLSSLQNNLELSLICHCLIFDNLGTIMALIIG